MNFPSLNLPKAALQLSKKEGIVFVFCLVRKKKLQLTPEEWVRQHIIHFLLTEQKIPLARIASEYALTINGQTRRADLIVFEANFSPWMLIECKETRVSLNDQSLLQASNYVKETKAPFLWISNGIDHQLYDCLENKMLSEFPEM